MRRKMRLDCTGEPPGELTVTATEGVLARPNAFSSGPARAAIERPGRSGVTMPIAPEMRSTGTTGPRSKNHIRGALSARELPDHLVESRRGDQCPVIEGGLHPPSAFPFVILGLVPRLSGSRLSS